ncbi:TIGR01212 family radical SAM protein [Thermodesulforhabdus norvegica]|uniref:Radical SAM core domain-containing protein n=1 Tax=Thermodesulforhabdus norvegica TaxID=39841 RepID=A0A1I4VKW9_9BACT|nr:TIGR01212 family radical SAM protein [Thermodesulforhabdus norvegica]SFN01769.1 hypothetical protein SAMN05660836_02341 [Thermodesulforhabdus norvegica]
MRKPYREYKQFLTEKFGCRVHKISLDAGLTCPNRDGTAGTGGCIYCNARGSGTGAHERALSIREQIDNSMEYLRKRFKAEKFLAYFQSFSNTYAPLPRLKSLYEEALSVKDVVGITIGTRPDCVNEEILDYLAFLQKRTYLCLEYGLQSAHDRTLKIINRGHDVATFVKAVDATRRLNIPVCVHVILGLPGETEEDMLETAKFLAGLDIQAIKIHVLYVIKDTVLEQMYLKGQYKCLEREDYVRIAARFLACLPPHVVIQRVTGDPHRNELVAPSWTLEKQKNIAMLVDYMETNNLKQGSWFKKSFASISQALTGVSRNSKS